MEEMTEDGCQAHGKEGGHLKAIGKHMFSDPLSLMDMKLPWNVSLWGRLTLKLTKLTYHSNKVARENLVKGNYVLKQQIWNSKCHERSKTQKQEPTEQSTYFPVPSQLGNTSNSVPTLSMPELRSQQSGTIVAVSAHIVTGPAHLSQ